MLFLTPDELIELTHRRRGDAQSRELNLMSIPHKIRGDGSVAVLKALVDKEFGLSDKAQKKRIEPNWDQIHAPQT